MLDLKLNYTVNEWHSTLGTLEQISKLEKLENVVSYWVEADGDLDIEVGIQFKGNVILLLDELYKQNIIDNFTRFYFEVEGVK